MQLNTIVCVTIFNNNLNIFLTDTDVDVSPKNVVVQNTAARGTRGTPKWKQVEDVPDAVNTMYHR